MIDTELALPRDLEAERDVLGAILLNETAYDQASDIGLMPADFSLDSHRRIYSAISDMREAGQDVDLWSVCRELDSRKQLSAVGDTAYITGLLDGVPENLSIKSRVKLIQDVARRCNLIHACNAAIAQATDGASKTPECLSNLGDTLLQIQGGLNDAPAHRLATFTDAAIADWNKRADSDQLPGLTTGIKALDEMTTGIRPREYWSIGAHQGIGKTALGLQIAAANVKRGIPVALFSLELSQDEILERLWSHEFGVNFSQVRWPRNLPADVRKRIVDAACNVGKRPLFIYDDASLSIQKLMAKARVLIRREKVKLIVVDHVQLVGANAPNERERIGKVSNGLRSLAKETGVPVLVHSQLVKPPAYNPNHLPNGFMFRESSSVRDDSHVCLLIYRPVHDDENAQAGQPTGSDRIIIDKQRHGPRDFVKVKFLHEKQLFGER